MIYTPFDKIISRAPTKSQNLFFLKIPARRLLIMKSMRKVIEEIEFSFMTVNIITLNRNEKLKTENNFNDIFDQKNSQSCSLLVLSTTFVVLMNRIQILSLFTGSHKFIVLNLLYHNNNIA